VIEEEEVDVEAIRGSAPVEAPTPDPSPQPETVDLVAAEAKGLAEVGEELTAQTAIDAPLCFTCGVKMRPAGSCYVCESCGSTSGCS
jgi:ribonucleoside-diphosphate reductase alpha chain